MDLKRGSGPNAWIEPAPAQAARAVLSARRRADAVELLGEQELREASHRQAYWEILKAAGMAMKMPQLTIATAAVFCHRFYACKSSELEENHRQYIATACLFLAGKVEETPKPVRDVIANTVRELHRTSLADRDRFLANRDYLDMMRARVLAAEIDLLHTLGFDFGVVHPYPYLLKDIREIGLSLQPDEQKQLVQCAWNFANDSLRTTVALQHQPRTISAACLHLACKLLELPLAPRWWAGLTGVSLPALLDVGHRILDLYDPKVAAAMQGAARRDVQARQAAAAAAASAPAAGLAGQSSRGRAPPAASEDPGTSGGGQRSRPPASAPGVDGGGRGGAGGGGMAAVPLSGQKRPLISLSSDPHQRPSQAPRGGGGEGPRRPTALPLPPEEDMDLS